MRRNRLTEYVTEEQVERFIENIERIAKFVELESHLEVVNDPNDDIVINTAIDDRADLIVSAITIYSASKNSEEPRSHP